MPKNPSSLILFPTVIFTKLISSDPKYKGMITYITVLNMCITFLDLVLQCLALMPLLGLRLLFAFDYNTFQTNGLQVKENNLRLMKIKSKLC